MIHTLLNNFEQCSCGERGIRTPGPVTVNGFQDRRNRPLCHLSAAKVIIENDLQNLFLLFSTYFSVQYF